MAVANKRLTLEEFLELPEEEPALEYMNGVVSQKVSPKAKHDMLQYRLAECINARPESAEIAVALPEVRTTFAGKSPVPDVSIYRWARVPVDTEGEIADDLREAPDVAIEIMSPGQRMAKAIERCQWYVSNGVQVALIVEPRRHSVRAFWANGASAEWHGVDHLDISAVVPGFTLTVDELFGALRVRRAPGR